MPNPQPPAAKAPARPSYGIVSKFVQLAGAQWIHDGLHTVFLIYLARLSTSDYGEFTIAFSLASIILFLGEFGLNQPLVTSLCKKFSHKGDILAQYTLLKSVLLVLGWLGVLVFVFWQHYTSGLKNLVLVITAGVGLEAIASSFFVAIRVEGRQDLEGRIKVVAGLVGYGYAISLLALGAKPHWIALFKLLENLINLGGGIWMALKKTEFSGLAFKRNSMARIWATAKHGTVFVLMALAAILYNKANIYFLQNRAGPVWVAQYSVTWDLVDGISTLVSNLLLRSILYPLFVRLWKSDKSEFTRLANNSVRWLIGASLPVMFVLFIESDRIIGFVYGQAYHDSIWMQKWLVWTILCGFVHNLSAYLMMSQGKERLLLVIYTGGLALNLALCSTLIKIHPLLGTCLSILITKAAVAITTTAYCQKTLHIMDVKSLWRIAVAAVCGAVLYFATLPLGIREIPEILALLPFCYLIRAWWLEIKAQRLRAGLA